MQEQNQEQKRKAPALIQIRCTVSEKESWEQQAQENDLTLADMIRMKMGKPTRKHIPRHDPKLIRQITGIGNNINQLAVMARLDRFESRLQLVAIMVSLERAMHEILEREASAI